jgi:hypothetical protein
MRNEVILDLFDGPNLARGMESTQVTLRLSDVRPPTDAYYDFDRTGIKRLMTDIAATGGLSDPIEVFQTSGGVHPYAIGDGEARYLACKALDHETIAVVVQPGDELEAKLKRLRRQPAPIRGHKNSCWRSILIFRDATTLLRGRLGSHSELTQAAIVQETGIDKGSVSHFIKQLDAVQRAGLNLDDPGLYRLSRNEFRRMERADVAEIHRIVAAAQKPVLTGLARRQNLDDRFAWRFQIDTTGGESKMTVDFTRVPGSELRDFQQYVLMMLRERG